MRAKRWIAAVLAAALAVMMLAGCDGSSSSSSDSGNSSSGGNNSSSSSSDNGNGNSGGSSSSSSSGSIFDSTDGKLDVNEVNRMLKAAKSEITCASSTEMDQFVEAFAGKVKATKEADFSITMRQEELYQEAEDKWGQKTMTGILAALGYQMMGYSTIERAAAESILQLKGYADPMPEELTVSGYKVHTQGGPQYWIFCFTWANASNAPDAGSQASR